MSFVPMILFGDIEHQRHQRACKTVVAFAVRLSTFALFIMAIWGLGYLMFHFQVVRFSKNELYSNFAHGKTLSYSAWTI